MQEIRVDMRKRSTEEIEIYAKHEELVFRLNHTMPRTEEYQELLKELFEGRMGEGSFLRAPLAGAAFDKISIGDRVFINSNLLAMARGGITIEDDVQIAANVQLLSNNHDSSRRAYRESFQAPEAEILVVDDTVMNLTVFKGLLKQTKNFPDILSTVPHQSQGLSMRIWCYSWYKSSIL